MRGIFYNSKYNLCSIWESGKMCYDALSKSSLYVLDYSENQSEIDNTYDFIIVNYHHCTNPWVTHDMILSFNKPNFCIVTEVGLTSNLLPVTPDFFDKYILLDPTIEETSKIFAFGRPLEDITLSHSDINDEIPRIGSFGFATYGKEWHKIVECVNNEFEEAIVNLNINKGDYVPSWVYEKLMDEVSNNINNINLKPGIKVNITNNILSKSELIDFCKNNTINCFFYNRNSPEYGGAYSAGLAAVTDQAIVSEQPLLVSDDMTFRHIHKYLDYYPTIGIKEAIEKNKKGVLQMKNDWSCTNFMKKFEEILFS